MNEAPRPSELGDERAPVATEREHSPTPPDAASEPGLRCTVARYPMWLIIGAVIVFALVALYLAWVVAPASP